MLVWRHNDIMRLVYMVGGGTMKTHRLLSFVTEAQSEPLVPLSGLVGGTRNTCDLMPVVLGGQKYESDNKMT